MSLFSLVQKLTGSGIAPIFQDLITFYRAAFHPVAHVLGSFLKWLLSIVHIHIFDIPADFVILYSLFGASFFRYTYNDWQDYEVTKTDFNKKEGEIILEPVPFAKGVMYIGFLSLLWPIIVAGALPLYLYWHSKFMKLPESVREYPDATTVMFISKNNMITVNPKLWFYEMLKVMSAFLLIFGTNAYFTM